MLTTAKAWELRDRDVVVIKGAHYTLQDDPKPGPPGWTSLRTTDRDGLLVCHMIEGTEPVNVVRPKDFRPQIERARRLDNQRRKR
jgi:hypothetical protein